MRRRVATNLLWMIAERGLQVGAGIGVVAMLARALGPIGFAHFQYAQSVVAIAATVALVCSSEVIVPRLVANPTTTAQHGLLIHAFTLRLAGGVAGYVLMCLFLAITNPVRDIWHAALLLGMVILLREPFAIVVAWLQAHINTRPSTLFNIVSLAAKAILVGTLFMLGIRDADGYAAAFVLEAVLLAALLSIYYLSRVEERGATWDRPLTRDLMTTGSLFWVSFMLMMGARRIDQLVLQPLVPTIEFGAYAACVQILDNFTMIASILAAGIAPAYVYGRTQFAEAHRNIGRISVGLGAVGIVGGLAIAASAPWIVRLLYGTAFEGTVALLRAAALMSSLVFADVGLTLLVTHLRRPRWVAVKWAFVFSATLVFDLIVIPHYGSWGAIAGYGLGNSVAVVVGLILWWQHRPRPVAAPPTDNM